MADIEVNFNVETQDTAQKRLAAGYRARRNFLAIELFSMIVRLTPVKDGYARGGWHISVGSPKDSGPRAPDKDGGATIMEALGALRGVGAFQNLFIVNDVEYIDQLENGSSMQAPDGIVRVSLPAFKSAYGDVA